MPLGGQAVAGRVTVLHFEPIELARTVWRRQALPIGSLNCNGRKLDFTKDYIQNQVQSFNDRAFDAVPPQRIPTSGTPTTQSAPPVRSSDCRGRDRAARR
jgi:hypothetical protein